MRNSTVKKLKNGNTQVSTICESDADLIRLAKRTNLSGDTVNSNLTYISNFENIGSVGSMWSAINQHLLDQEIIGVSDNWDYEYIGNES